MLARSINFEGSADHPIIITLAVDEWLLDKLAGFGAEAEDLEGEEGTSAASIGHPRVAPSVCGRRCRDCA